MKISIKQLKQIIKEQVEDCAFKAQSLEEARLTPAQKRREAEKQEQDAYLAAHRARHAKAQETAVDTVYNLRELLAYAEHEYESKGYGGDSTWMQAEAVKSLKEAIKLVEGMALFQTTRDSGRVSGANEREYDTVSWDERIKGRGAK